MPLTRAPNLKDPDGFYQELIESQRGMSDDQAAAMNARLVLVLANHVGDRTVLSEAIATAAAAGRVSRT